MTSNLGELLNAEREQLETEATSLRDRMALDEIALAKTLKRLQHVQGLLGDDDDNAAREGVPQPRPNAPSGPANAVCDIAVSVLREQDRTPMYYKDLADAVMARGGTLNGMKPWATLVARLVRDERFVRPTAKGFYALKEDYPNASSVGARRSWSHSFTVNLLPKGSEREV